MRAVLPAVLSIAVGCGPIDDLDEDAVDPVILVNAESTGEAPDPPAQFLRAVVGFEPEADADYSFAFNETGIPVSTLPQLPVMTPFLPRPVDDISLQLLGEVDGAGIGTLASTGEFTLDEDLGQVILYGSFQEPRGMALGLDEAPVTPGSLAVRLVHITPGLAYAGFGPRIGAPVIAAFEEDTSPWIILDAGTDHEWFLDVNGDGRGDVPYTAWQLPPTDALGRPQVVDIFVVPSGATLPPPNPPLPVPILVITPLTGPDEAISAVPNLGG